MNISTVHGAGRECAAQSARCRVIARPNANYALRFWSMSAYCDDIVVWETPDGAVREAAPHDEEFPIDAFAAAGVEYRGLGELAHEEIWDNAFRGVRLWRDARGRPVVEHYERFPVFDSYDAATEDRFYRWFYLLEAGELWSVYFEGHKQAALVTRDVPALNYMAKRGLAATGIIDADGWLHIEAV